MNASGSDNAWEVWDHKRQEWAGPFGSGDLIELAKAGKLNAGSLIRHPENTGGKTSPARAFPKLASAILNCQANEQPPPLPELDPKRPSRQLGTLGIVIVVLAIVGSVLITTGFVLAIVAGPATSTPTTKSKSGINTFMLGVDLEYDIKKRVKSVLKAPSTASFELKSHLLAGTNQRGERVGFVDGYVTAKNPFGVPLRNRISGLYLISSDGKSFQAGFIQFDDGAIGGSPHVLAECKAITGK